jgi:hypothetical protein
MNCNIYIANFCSFIVINWIEILILIIVCYKIIDIKDEINIKKELVIIIIVWTGFSLFYFSFLQIRIANIHDTVLVNMLN